MTSDVTLIPELLWIHDRFYPGGAGPSMCMPAIPAGEANQAIGELDAPASPLSDSHSPSNDDRMQQDDISGPSAPKSSLGSGSKARRVASTRPQRVVGSLEHPILPMPPVSAVPLMVKDPVCKDLELTFGLLGAFFP